jgi:hypothetical protein
MLTEEQAAAAYEEATDGCRCWIRDTRDKWQRVKPDSELHPSAELDWKKEPTWDEPLVTTPLPHLCPERTDCITLVIQPLAPFARPSETDPVAAV